MGGFGSVASMVLGEYPVPKNLISMEPQPGGDPAYLAQYGGGGGGGGGGDGGKGGGGYADGGGMDSYPVWRQGLADIARHVIETQRNPRFLSQMPSFDMASNICSALFSDRVAAAAVAAGRMVTIEGVRVVRR